MHISLVAVAGRASAWVAEAIARYQKRLPREWQFDARILPPAKSTASSDANGRKQDEWRRIQKLLNDKHVLVLLDERGKSLTSRDLATRIADWQADGRNVTFIIGGPDGIAQECRSRADLILSLSALTMPHEMARIVLMEQLYRAKTIIDGHPYHRD
ncbi:MAG: 23S rRNA (pseudouridine(1915)-N(3))-methyltransferase RlmH [Pseudomonadota bacterium]